MPDSCYLPLPFHWSGTLKVRFAGGYLLLGSGAGWRAPDNDRPSELLVVDVHTGTIHRLPVKHGVDRIETMGSAALLAGSTSRNLHLTTVRLDAEPSVVDHRVVRRVLDERTESHGIYYLPQSAERGIVAVALERHRYSDGQRRSASILYFDSHSLRLSELGLLESRRERSGRADYRGGFDIVQPNSLGDRVLGLFGSEIVEGSLRDNTLREIGRIHLDQR